MGHPVPQRPQGRRSLSYTKVCEHCGKDYYPIRHDQRFCSRECSHWLRLLEPKKCKICGQGFQPARRRVRYCSITCARKSRAIQLGDDWMLHHMRRMRDAAAQAHHQAAVDRAVQQLPADITAAQAYRLGVTRGRNIGYQAGFRIARRFEAELKRLKEGQDA